MNISSANENIIDYESDAAIIGLFDDDKDFIQEIKSIDNKLDGLLDKLIEKSEISRGFGEIREVHTFGHIKPERLIVIGLGSSQEFSISKLRLLMAKVIRYCENRHLQCISSLIHFNGEDSGIEKVAQALTEGLLLGIYQFDRYKKNKKESNDIDFVITEIEKSKIGAINRGIKTGQITASSTNLCRDFINEPANVLTPTEFSTRITQILKHPNLNIEILGTKEMQDLGMNAALGVAKGSSQLPKLIIIDYKGCPENNTNTITFIGKGITFDSGGISLKPALNMGDMKGDMSGAAAVISATKAIAELNIAVNLKTIVIAAENMPGASAQKPGDIVISMSGKSIEIDNTDAEGRLILADAITYARKLGAQKIVDVATLTGAISVALGNVYAGIFGNDQLLIDQIICAGENCGEKFWQLPLSPDYAKQNDSVVADIKNTGGRLAGSITAAEFLHAFVEDTPWVHIDIAGTARSRKNTYMREGATGIAVRTLVDFAKKL